MVVATIALAINSSLLTRWRDLGENAPIIFLLSFTGIAVATWSLARLVAAVRYRGVGRSSKRRWVGVVRDVMATAIFIPTAATAYLEFSAYAQSSAALRAVDTRLFKSTDGRPLTRLEVETLLKQESEPLPTGDLPGEIEVTYRWKGVFRTYTLRAKYVRSQQYIRYWPAKPPEEETRSYVLDWISDTLE